jgi:hypothetical protein
MGWRFVRLEGGDEEGNEASRYKGRKRGFGGEFWAFSGILARGKEKVKQNAKNKKEPEATGNGILGQN